MPITIAHICKWLSLPSPDFCEGIRFDAKRKVVGNCDNVNSMREVPLSSHIFLKGCCRRSTTIYLVVPKTTDFYQQKQFSSCLVLMISFHWNSPHDQTTW
jgi:hypothetical protein